MGLPKTTKCKKKSKKKKNKKTTYKAIPYQEKLHLKSYPITNSSKPRFKTAYSSPRFKTAYSRPRFKTTYSKTRLKAVYPVPNILSKRFSKSKT